MNSDGSDLVVAGNVLPQWPITLNTEVVGIAMDAGHVSSLGIE